MKKLPRVIVDLIKDLSEDGAKLDSGASGLDNFRIVTSIYSLEIRVANKERTRFFVDSFNHSTGQPGGTLNLSKGQFTANIIKNLLNLSKKDCILSRA